MEHFRRFSPLLICWILVEGASVSEYEINVHQLLGIRENVDPPLVQQVVGTQSQVHFQLYTRENGKNGVHLTMENLSSFQINLPVKMLIHGFLGQSKDRWMVAAKEALLRKDDLNVILVGWTEETQPLMYPQVVEESYEVARRVGRLIDVLVGSGTLLANVHIIGHSVGAHIAGVASKESKAGIVGRITGLDAAYPLYRGFPENNKLDQSDAEFVDCIHTSSGLLGVPEPFCDADFYPNGGSLYQPGCDVLALAMCSHSRAYDYFVESINSNAPFKAFSCSNMFLALLDCVDEGAVMGYSCDSSHKGVFYVRTGDEPPYSVSPLFQTSP